ncbi:MAG: hypothetical protein NUV46_00855 [Nanoarchaeota archaeon]|nr:hypothetical protein [Nanoarchaeota archaeon]
MKQMYSGLSITVFGLFLIVASFIWDITFLIFGIPILILGGIILINKKEENIEKIKYEKGGKKSKR